MQTGTSLNNDGLSELTCVALMKQQQKKRQRPSYNDMDTYHLKCQNQKETTQQIQQPSEQTTIEIDTTESQRIPVSSAIMSNAHSSCLTTIIVMFRVYLFLVT